MTAIFLSMYDIRPIPDERLDEFVRIVALAYPGMKLVSDEDLKKEKERFLKQSADPRHSTWGCFRDDTLLGGVRLHNFRLTLLDTLHDEIFGDFA